MIFIPVSIETSNELSFYCLRTFFCCKMERSIAFLRILMQHDAIVSLKHNKFLDVFKHVDVSENSGTPKSSILIGLSIINHPFWGTPIFGNPHVLSCSISEVIWRMWMDVMTTTLWSCSTELLCEEKFLHPSMFVQNKSTKWFTETSKTVTYVQ